LGTGRTVSPFMPMAHAKSGELSQNRVRLVTATGRCVLYIATVLYLCVFRSTIELGNFVFLGDNFL